MSRERDEFIALMSKELPDSLAYGQAVDWCRKLMRLSHTHARLQEAACNGDYPADNGERETVICSECGMGWAAESVSKKTGKCKSCRIEDSITAHCKPLGIVPDFQGDPRGCTVKLKVPSGKTNDWGQVGICVPE